MGLDIEELKRLQSVVDGSDDWCGCEGELQRIEEIILSAVPDIIALHDAANAVMPILDGLPVSGVDASNRTEALRQALGG